MTTDFQRPQFHFLPPSNWMNDPNGLIYWQGRTHLYYQHNPGAAVWGDMHWGHADSPDLIHWTHRPIGLAPQPGSPDADGCFSGCAVETEGRVAFLYTGVVAQPGGFRESPCLAWGDGDLLTLRQDPANPIISAPPAGLAVTGFRDHTVWKHGGEWRMAIGSGVEGEGGRALLYASPDLRSWEYKGALCSHQDIFFQKVIPSVPLNLGKMWECPAFFFDGPLAGLLVSACGDGRAYGVVILTGEYQDPHFIPHFADKLDHGGAGFYAPQLFKGPGGRTLMFGWLPEARSVDAQVRAGWAGVMSLPRQITIRPDGQPEYAFAAELETLRGEALRFTAMDLDAGLHPLSFQGAQAEVILELERGTSKRSGLVFLRSPDGAEETRLVVDWDAGEMSVERGRSSLDQEAVRDDLSAPLTLDNGVLRLHLVLDASVFECIAARRVALSGRIYPSRVDSLGWGLFSEGGKGLVRRLDLYPLASAW